VFGRLHTYGYEEIDWQLWIGGGVLPGYPPPNLLHITQLLLVFTIDFELEKE
jgi:hypothetical protein